MQLAKMLISSFMVANITNSGSTFGFSHRVCCENSLTSDTSRDFYKQPACGSAQREAGGNKDE